MAASIGELFGAELALVRAYRYPLEPIGGWSAEDRRRLDEARIREEAALSKRARRLGRGRDADVTMKVVQEEPAAVILEAAEGQKSLLAVGSRGLGALGRARFGSVSSKVLRVAAGPVLVYPHASCRSGWTASAKETTASTGRRLGIPGRG